MKRYGFLFENLFDFGNLLDAARKAMKGKKDKAAVADFHLNMETELLSIQQELADGAYRPGPYRCFEIFEPKRRYICAAQFRDRVVHHAICNILGPIFENIFISDSYACRECKGTHKAVRRVQGFSRKRRYFLKADVKKFFESMDHAVLKYLLERKIKDRRFLDLLFLIIDHPVPGHAPGKGVAIGNLTSQWFANYYLDCLDHYLKDERGVKQYARYMDDFVLLSNDKKVLHLLKADISRFLNERLMLALKEKACFIMPVHEGIPFLGFRIFPNLIRLNHNGLVRFSRKIRKKEQLCRAGKITEDALIRSAASLLGHVGHADTLNMRRRFFYGDILG